ncbi:glycosyltransferase family 2 protein [Flavobacterium sp. 1355]|uniref:glycosyltransferase family 2 protein n=1 Tax=Flavobacterium sp. 1355 TaxID=2806571 RepID=UPI00397D8DC5
MLNSHPLISIIMPAYNAELYISDAVNSVIKQTYTNWELIIIDDGSTDKTANIVNQLVESDSRINYHYQENGKQGKARNYGISKSKGIYLAFLDADDLWLPEKLKMQITQIEEKNVDLVFSDSYVFNDNQVFDISKKMNIPDSVFHGPKSLQLFLKTNKVPILTVLVKKEKVTDVECFSQKLDIQNVEDYHLWLKLLMTNCIFYSSNRVLAKYRIHNNSVTSSDKMVVDKVPNVFFDLLQLYPNYKRQIQKELKLKFRLIYKRNIFTKLELSQLIKKNAQYLSKSKYAFIYLFFNFLFPTKLTKRLLMKILNA